MSCLSEGCGHMERNLFFKMSYTEQTRTCCSATCIFQKLACGNHFPQMNENRRIYTYAKDLQIIFTGNHDCDILQQRHGHEERAVFHTVLS